MSQRQCPNCGSYKIDSRDGGSCSCAVYSLLIGGFLFLVARFLGGIPDTYSVVFFGIAFLATIYYIVYTQKHFRCESCGKLIDI
jgi:hypothetical protein